MDWWSCQSVTSSQISFEGLEETAQINFYKSLLQFFWGCFVHRFAHKLVLSEWQLSWISAKRSWTFFWFPRNAGLCSHSPSLAQSAQCLLHHKGQPSVSKLMCWGKTIKNFLLPCPVPELPVVQHGASTPVSWSCAWQYSGQRFLWEGWDVLEDYLQSGQLKPWFYSQLGEMMLCCVCTSPWSSSEDHLQQYCDSTQDLSLERARVQLVILMIPLACQIGS